MPKAAGYAEPIDILSSVAPSAVSCDAFSVRVFPRGDMGSSLAVVLILGACSSSEGSSRATAHTTARSVGVASAAPIKLGVHLNLTSAKALSPLVCLETPTNGERSLLVPNAVSSDLASCGGTPCDGKAS